MEKVEAGAAAVPGPHQERSTAAGPKKAWALDDASTRPTAPLGGGFASNAGIRCGCIPQAWFAMFVSAIQIVFLAPFALCSRRMHEKWVAALVLFRFCWYGMDPYCANVCLFFGLTNLMKPGQQLSDFSVPGDRNWNRRKPIRIKDEYMSQLIGEDWHMSEGDCDIWFPYCLRSLAASILIFLGRWYKPNKSGQNKCTKPQYQGMLKKTILQLGDYGVRVNLAEGMSPARGHGYTAKWGYQI